MGRQGSEVRVGRWRPRVRGRVSSEKVEGQRSGSAAGYLCAINEMQDLGPTGRVQVSGYGC